MKGDTRSICNVGLFAADVHCLDCSASNGQYDGERVGKGEKRRVKTWKIRTVFSYLQ